MNPPQGDGGGAAPLRRLGDGASVRRRPGIFVQSCGK